MEVLKQSEVTVPGFANIPNVTLRSEELVEENSDQTSFSEVMIESPKSPSPLTPSVLSDTSDTQSISDFLSPEEPKKKRKKRSEGGNAEKEESNFLLQATSYFKAKNEMVMPVLRDEITVFSEDVANTLRALTNEQYIEAKYQINQLLYQIRSGHAAYIATIQN